MNWMTTKMMMKTSRILVDGHSDMLDLCEYRSNPTTKYGSPVV